MVEKIISLEDFSISISVKLCRNAYSNKVENANFIFSHYIYTETLSQQRKHIPTAIKLTFLCVVVVEVSLFDLLLYVHGKQCYVYIV